MNIGFHLIPEHLVHQLMLLDHGFACKYTRYNHCFEMLAVSGDADARSGEALLDHLFNLLRLHRD